jgi:hypothetical protein
MNTMIRWLSSFNFLEGARMSPTRARKWSVTRRNGLGWYIVVRGILTLGLLFAVGSVVANFIFSNESALSLSAYLSRRSTWFTFMANALSFGFTMGIVFWYGNERAFRRHHVDNTES